MKRFHSFVGRGVVVLALSALAACGGGPKMTAPERTALKFLKAFVLMDKDRMASMMTEEGWKQLERRNPRGFGMADLDLVREAVKKNFPDMAIEVVERGRGFLNYGKGNYTPYFRYRISISATAEETASHPLVGKAWEISVLHNGSEWLVYEAR